MRVEYPIALDSDYAVWSAFGNRYWPAVYLADTEGRIRYHHFGEGEYDDGEWMIQHLLREARTEGIDEELVSVTAEGLEAQADWTNLGSPETYLGYQQGRAPSLPTVSRSTSLAATSRPSRCSSTTGPWPELGRSRGRRAC